MQSRHRQPVIVFGGGINGLGIIRNLGREGIPVYCVLEEPDPVIYSKFCEQAFVIRNFTHRPDAIMRFLLNPPGIQGRPVVFSTNDNTTLILSDLKPKLKDQYALLIPDKRVAETLILKSKFYDSLVGSKIKYPRVIDPKSINDVSKVGEHLGYPVFVRPSVSQDFTEVFRKKGFVANSETELVNCYEVAVKHDVDVIFQEIIPGPDSNIYGIAGYLDRKSRPLALFAYRRLRGWPVMFGNNTLAESMPIKMLTRVKNELLDYLMHLGYCGVMEAELKLDPRDGAYKLLEVNARSWWQNSFPTKCGLNIIYKAYLDAVGENVAYCDEYTAGVKWINTLGDLRSSILGKELMSPSWIRSLLGVKDYALLDLDTHDIAPAALSLLFELGSRRRDRIRRVLLNVS